jgi:hypothetical protein
MSRPTMRGSAVLRPYELGVNDRRARLDLFWPTQTWRVLYQFNLPGFY